MEVERDVLILIVSLTAMVLAVHANTVWRINQVAKRLKKLEKHTGIHFEKALDDATAALNEEELENG